MPTAASGSTVNASGQESRSRTVQNTATTVATPIAVTGTTHACSRRAFGERIANESTTSTASPTSMNHSVTP